MLKHIPKSSGVYQIKCRVDGKTYIGSAVNMHVRCEDHRSIPSPVHKLFLRYVGRALLTGGVLAAYISLTMFWQMPYDLWRAFNNVLMVASLLLTAFAGSQHRMFGVSFKFMLLSITIFFTLIMLLYIGSYVVTTTALVDKMVWIPFFYHDYNYHGFQSVTEYLNHENNYRELLGLQVLSLSMSSVLYFAAGSLVYSLKALLERTHGSSGTVPSGG